jgi:hypothetical protein
MKVDFFFFFPTPIYSDWTSFKVRLSMYDSFSENWCVCFSGAVSVCDKRAFLAGTKLHLILTASSNQVKESNILWIYTPLYHNYEPHAEMLGWSSIPTKKFQSLTLSSGQGIKHFVNSYATLSQLWAARRNFYAWLVSWTTVHAKYMSRRRKS